MNYLALLGWSPADGKTEILSKAELIRQFSLEHVIKSPAVFDLDKLYWLNRHYMKQCAPRHLAEKAMPFLEEAGYVTAQPAPEVLEWLERVLDAVLKNMRSLAELKGAVGLIFDYHAREACKALEASLTPGAREVLSSFIPKALADGQLTYERFREIAKDVQKETGKKGRDLFHPIRVALTGAVSGPELEKLIPIFEEGAKLKLARPVKSCAQRLREFTEAARLFGDQGSGFRDQEGKNS
jgi:glutamyl-tRNA synthetase/nondiscriminating glutamyl-tRNA synthetase